MFLILIYFINELYLNFLNAIVSSIIGCNFKDIKLVLLFCDYSFIANFKDEQEIGTSLLNGLKHIFVEFGYACFTTSLNLKFSTGFLHYTQGF